MLIVFISQYYVDRLYSICSLYDCEKYEVNICSGYYGQEIDSITLNDSTFQKAIEFLHENINDFDALQEYLLKLEYKYIHERLKNKKFSIVQLNLSEIKTPSNNSYMKVDVDYDVNKELPIGLVVLENGNYNLMDGHHRFFYCKKLEINTGLFVVAQ